jgi:hypothetical protein
MLQGSDLQSTGHPGVGTGVGEGEDGVGEGEVLVGVEGGGGGTGLPQLGSNLTHCPF